MVTSSEPHGRAGSPPGRSSSRVEAEIRRVGSLLERGSEAEALRAAEQLCDEVPENRDALYVLAVSRRRAANPRLALEALDRLEHHHPDFGRLFEERGHCQVDLRAAAAAIGSYQRAVEHNEYLLASWRSLEALWRPNGFRLEADQAAARARGLEALPAALLTAYVAFGDGDLIPAEEWVRGFCRDHGEHPEALRLLAKIAVRFEVEYDAQLLLERAVELSPGTDHLRYEYALVLLERGKHAEARREAEKLLAREPANRAYRTLQASACASLGDFDAALPAYRQLAAEVPGQPELALAVANLLRTQGRSAEAVEGYRRACELAPSFGEAFWSLANSKIHHFTDAEIEHMRAREADDGTSGRDRLHFCFALGKALEDRSRFAESFAYYERGNRLERARFRYQPQTLERRARLSAELCTAEFFASRAASGCDSAAPIFVVGLPRSGSTLVEQILASHPEVEGTSELANVPRLVEELQSSNLGQAAAGYPAVLAHLSAGAARRLGEKYLLDTGPYRRGRPRFVDKMLNNFRHIGLIQLALPRAKIIDIRREPMACCVGIFKQLFSGGQRFAYDLAEIADYYRMYMRLMTHWNRVLPGRILSLRYEDLVNDFEPCVRRLLDFCDLEFQPACLEFHRNPRAVHSVSSEQVRRPLYREGLDHWRNFEPWLAPLREALAAPGDPVSSRA